MFIVPKEKFAKWGITFLAVGFLYFKIMGIVVGYSDLPWFFEITKSLLSYAGPPATIVLMLIGFKRWGWAFGFLGLFTFLFSLVVIGTRGAIIYSLLLIAYMVFNFMRTKNSFFFMATGGLPNVVFKTGEGTFFSYEITDGSMKKAERSVIEEIQWRFGASARWSTKFIDMYDRGDGAGINPIRNSLLGFYHGQ